MVAEVDLASTKGVDAVKSDVDRAKIVHIVILFRQSLHCALWGSTPTAKAPLHKIVADDFNPFRGETLVSGHTGWDAAW